MHGCHICCQWPFFVLISLLQLKIRFRKLNKGNQRTDDAVQKEATAERDSRPLVFKYNEVRNHPLFLFLHFLDAKITCYSVLSSYIYILSGWWLSHVWCIKLTLKIPIGGVGTCNRMYVTIIPPFSSLLYDMNGVYQLI